MKIKNRKTALWLVGCALIVSAAVVCWKVFASPTRIAFVNYQAITLGQIAKANAGNYFVKIEELRPDELSRAGKFDLVLVNGMGLRITEEQRGQLENAADRGTPVLTTAATNPQNLIVSVDSVQQAALTGYLAGGNANYRNLLAYARHDIDGKRFRAPAPEPPVPTLSSLLYYPGTDEKAFASVAEYEKFLRAEGKWHDTDRPVILTGQMGVPDSLVAELERTGNRVYPVNVLRQFIMEGHADSVNAVAVINMAHGRLGDDVVKYLEAKNIPLFAPVNANQDYERWMADKMGLSGGFLSQSIVTPEIDGAIRPFTLFAHFKGSDGLPYVEAIPGRLQEFVETVNRYTALRTKPNSEKRVAVFYFKGPGQNALVAEGMDVAPSLYNLLTRLKAEGYRVDNLPADAAALERMIAEQGKVFGAYAKGAMADFVRTRNPQLISQSDYDRWCAEAFDPSMKQAVDSVDGKFPGHGLADDKGNLALARLQFGNVVLIPQTAAGLGDDDFKIVHGTDAAPPHAYVAAYLWARYGFKADALMHFGAHGSLEFTPRKQVALGSRDWSDRLVGTMPHFYIYSTSNVGEAMTAKRRSYATILNYLTPPFMESGVRNTYRTLSDAIAAYNKEAGADSPNPAEQKRLSLLVKKHVLELGIHRELRLDSIASSPYSAEEIARVESFAEELANEKITGALYVMGVPYSPEHITATVKAMTVDPIAYSLYTLDRQRRCTDIDYNRQRQRFNAVYRTKAENLFRRISAPGFTTDDAVICSIAGISKAELDSARKINHTIADSKDMLGRMMVMATMPGAKPGGMGKPGVSKGKSSGGHPSWIPKIGKRPAGHPGSKDAKGKGGKPQMPGMPQTPSFTKEQIDFASAVAEVENALANVNRYRDALSTSPQTELNSIVNALSGGFVSPTSGGDPVLNPNILPTGRNMFAVNAEETPSAVAWEKGKALAQSTLDMYRKAHADSFPRKVSYTLWSSEFIETEGATIAQVLYMLGVEPVRDPLGRVTDLRLIPEEELGRPRVDVVVQTSGQLRDLAASRLFLISRAVKMAAEAPAKKFPNYVADGVVDSERHLVDKGVSPREARELASQRVFGGVGGNYGSGIQSMVESGSSWTDRSQIAETYINNMGASYGSEEDWENFSQYAFEAALTNTDVVVQPRQSNTWGALSLDHVYEFMGGMNLAVKEVTGKDPDAYLADYRNRANSRMQEVKEAIGVESRTTILNPNYIKEKMKGGAADASTIADVVRNTYGWNVMKEDVIDNELWNDIYDTYVADKNNLGVKDFFLSANPAAIEEISAVMLETARKGMWKATDEQLAALAELHTSTVRDHGASCSGFVCDNPQLRDYIVQKAPRENAAAYREAVAQVRAEKAAGADDNSMVMQKEELNATETSTSHINGIAIGIAVLIVIALFFVVKRRRKNSKTQA